MGFEHRSCLDGRVRILFTFARGAGHFLPLTPVARAASRVGHVAPFAGQEGIVTTIEEAGPSGFRVQQRQPVEGGRAPSTRRGRPGARGPCDSGPRSQVRERERSRRAWGVVTIGSEWSPRHIIATRLISARRSLPSALASLMPPCFASPVTRSSGSALILLLLLFEPLTALRGTARPTRRPQSRACSTGISSCRAVPAELPRSPPSRRP